MLCASCDTVDASAPVLQSRAADEAATDPPGPEMALDHRDLRQVVCGGGDREAVGRRRLDLDRLRHHLVGHEPDRARLAALPRDPQVCGAHRPVAHRVLDPFGHVGLRDLVHGPPRLQRELGLEPFQVGQQQQVGLVAGRDRAEMPEAVPRRRVDRRQHDGVLRSDARGDRLAHHPVDVAVLGDVLGIAVVGAERDPGGAELPHQRQQRLEIARHRRLADQQPHAVAKPLASLVGRQRLVIRPDAGRDVRVELLPEQSRCVAVDLDALGESQLVELAGIAVDDSGEIHHLGEPEDAAPTEQALEVAAQQAAGAVTRTPRREWTTTP